jgi:predicted MFS family arabinose efflux permease
MWIRVVDRPGAYVFGSLNAVEAFSRSLIAGVLPFEAERLIRDAQDISLLYTLVGAVGLFVSFLVPLVLRRLRRKWIFSTGVGCMLVAPLMLMLASEASFTAALLFRGIAVVAVNISINLYILDYIRKKELSTSEPVRLAFLGIAWCTGPASGIYLYKTFGLAAVCIPSACFAAAALTFFWILRLQDNPAVAPATRRPPMPWQYIGQFLRQPRLRLAWIIPFGRSTFWTTFFVYPPLYIIRNGGEDAMVAMMLSGGQALLFIAPVFGRIGRRFGIRPVIITAAVFTGALSIVAGLTPLSPLAAAILFFIAAFGSVALDAVGNIPFLRSVHYYERSEMTSVFRTYIEASQLVPAAIYTMVLAVAPLQSVFVVLGLILLVSAWYARYLPKSL